MDRKLAEMSYEYNRRITNLSAEYDKLASLVTQILARGQSPEGFHAPDPTPSRVPDLMHSLSQVAAISLQNQLLPQAAAPAPPPSITAGITTTTSTLGAVAAALSSGIKRAAPEEAEASSDSRQRTS